MAAPYTRDRNKGSLILELMIATALFSLCILSSAEVILESRSAATNAEISRQELYAAKSALENTRVQADMNFNSIISSSEISGPFLISLNETDLTQCKKSVTATASTVQSPILLTSLTTMFVDTLYDKNIGNDCLGDEPSGDWKNAHILSSTALPLPVSTNNIDVLNGKAFITNSSASSSTLFIFDVSNKSRPQPLASLVLPFSVNALDAAEHYVYLAADGTSSQFSIIDISNPPATTIIASSTLPGVAGSFPGALSVFYYNHRAYIGTHRTAGNEFHIFDVSNPKNPIWLGSIELNHNINEISVRDSYAYLATSGNIDNLIILDISNPAHIQKIATLAFSGTEDSQSIFLIGNKLYIGRKISSSQADPEFLILNISNPYSPIIIGSLYLHASVLSMSVAGSYAYLGTDSPQKPIQIIDISNSAHPAAIAYPVVSASPLREDYENNALYAASPNNLIILSP